MSIYKVDYYGGTVEVKLHDKPLIGKDELREPSGRISCCLAPYQYKEFQPHYYIKYQEEDDMDGWIVVVACQIFAVDHEYDGFITEVEDDGGGNCETRIHNHHDTLLDSDILHALASKIEEAESVIPDIGKQIEAALLKKSKSVA